MQKLRELSEFFINTVAVSLLQEAFASLLETDTEFQEYFLEATSLFFRNSLDYHGEREQRACVKSVVSEPSETPTLLK